LVDTVMLIYNSNPMIKLNSFKLLNAIQAGLESVFQIINTFAERFNCY